MEQEGFLWIESRREEYLSFLRRLVCTESHSFDRAGVIGAGRVVEDFVRGKGFPSSVSPLRGRGTVC